MKNCVQRLENKLELNEGVLLWSTDDVQCFGCQYRVKVGEHYYCSNQNISHYKSHEHLFDMDQINLFQYTPEK